MATHFKNKISATNKGFTLLETLVAILLLSVAVAGAATITQKALQAAEYSRDETTAYYLAAEGLELIQNIRDNNSLSGASEGWLAGLVDNCQNTACDVTASNEALIPCPGGDGSENMIIQGQPVPDNDTQTQYACPLYFSSTTDQYGDGSSFGTATRFFRSMTIKPILLPDTTSNEAEVVASVVWNTGPFSTRTVNLEETIFNWY